MGDLSVLDPVANPLLLEQLNPSVVMVGLNISRAFPEEPFRNFHDPSSVANDYKIRFAFEGTRYWGAYMTDVIKGFVEPVSGKLMAYLKMHPEVVDSHIRKLRAEIADLGVPKPKLLVFGRAAFRLLMQNLSPDDYSLLVPLTHYSHHISKEKYREVVLHEIASAEAASV
ncbi:hypothetical protein [Thermostilla marina]